MIQIEIDKAQLAKVEFMLAGIEDGSATVLMRAINRTLTGVKTDLDRETRKILNIKSSRVKKDMSSSTASKARLRGQVNSAGKPVGLTQFSGTKQKKKGVSVSVRKDTRRSIIQRAFIAKGRGDNIHVFWRKWSGTRQPHKNIAYAKLPRKYRLPIKTLYGPRIQDIQADPAVQQGVQVKASGRLNTRIAYELNYLLRKYSG